VEEEPFGKEKTLCLCNLVEEERCGKEEEEGKTEPTQFIFFKCFHNNTGIIPKSNGACQNVVQNMFVSTSITIFFRCSLFTTKLQKKIDSRTRHFVSNF